MLYSFVLTLCESIKKYVSPHMRDHIFIKFTAKPNLSRADCLPRITEWIRSCMSLKNHQDPQVCNGYYE